MKNKALSIFVGIILLVGLFAAPSPALAWSSKPKKVTFLNDQGITLTGWVFKPAGKGPFPAVVMMHGCSGVYSYSDTTRGIMSLYREWADRLVKAGYVALLVDSFTPRNALQNQCNIGGAAVSEVNDRTFDAYAGLNYLASLSYVSADRVGLLGWSQGGTSIMAAVDVTKASPLYNFKAAATFYPGCGMRDAFGGIGQSTWKPYAPLVILQGSADMVVDPTLCQARLANAQALGATSASMTLFNNAQHSFDLAKKVTDTFTQFDVDAKVAADAQAMQLFATYLP
jgi:dienelactone hydrolase